MQYKRYGIWILTILSVAFAGALFLLDKSGGNYCVGAEICPHDKMAVKLEGKTQIDAVPDTITFNDHSSFYDAGTNTIFVSQAIDSDDFQGRLSASEGVLYIEKDPLLLDKKAAVRESKKFTLYQMMDDRYCRYNLLFTGVPVIALSVTDSCQKEIHYRDNTLYTAKVSIEDPYHKKTYYQEAQAEFYMRGQLSFVQNFSKRNYKLNLIGDKLSILGMRKDDDWLLNGFYDDAGMIHNKLSYEVWNQLSAYNRDAKIFTTNMEYADLFIDDEYMGLYGIMERIDEKELKLEEGDILYKCRSENVPEEKHFTNESIDGRRPMYVTKYPDEPREEDWEPLKKWVDCFRRGWVDSPEEAIRLLDYQNAIDYNLYCLLIYGDDNIDKNYFLVAEKQNDGEYKIKHIPWDLNATWGNSWDNVEGAIFPYYDSYTITNPYTWSPEIYLLYNYDEQRIAKDMYERWKELRQTIYTKENICRIADEQFAYLYDTGAYGHNYEWCDEYDTSWKDEYLYQFIEGRLAFLDTYFEKLYRISVGEEAYIYNGVDYTAEFRPLYYWLRNHDVLGEIYDKYNEDALLEHYALYGKPNGLIAKQQ